jgi:TRAP transporter 4TM/12TM fusion protein
VLSFLLFPALRRFRNRVMPWDWLLIAAALGCMWYMLTGGEDYTDRASLPNPTDVAVGLLFIGLVLEATRRTTGLIMPILAVLFVLYALYGKELPAPWTHRGYDLERLTGHLVITLEGVLGTAVDVSSSLIILFTIFGAFLQFSGAGKFFIDFSFALFGGKRNAAGRTVVLASFLMGGPSGSGVATTVSIGSVAWPMLARSGYGANAAGGMLAAGGLGAIISPPVLGAAAFLIAEFLKISYLDVIAMAAIPTLLYYLSLLFMVEIDARRATLLGHGDARVEAGRSAWELTRRFGFHFLSLASIVGFLLMGFSPVLSVVYATLTTLVVSHLSRETALNPGRLVRALEAGAVQTLNVASTCAAAGIIVGVVTLTGLGLKFSQIAIDAAGGSLLLTAIYTALIVWIVGLAVPVTASYIICAVIAAPALTKLGVPPYAAHMFIFYYAVLSEVSPPTALSPFAAAAITGGNPYLTTLQSWKYTLPAFLVPFVFVLDADGVGLLLHVPKGGDEWDIVAIALVTALGIGAFACAFQKWLLFPTNHLERALLFLAGLLLVFPSLVDGVARALAGIGVGFHLPVAIALAAVALSSQLLRRPRAAT